MEIIYKGNKHNEPKPDPEYGCICDSCGSVFTFKTSEIRRPKTVLSTEYQVTACPICDTIIFLNYCTRFCNKDEKEKFISLHLPAKTENN